MIGEDVMLPSSETDQLRLQLLQAQRLSSVGALASSVAHEFNNILMTVINYAKMGVRHKDAATRDKSFEKILAAGHRASKITTGMLSYARQQSDRRESMDLVPLWSTAGPTSAESKQHWDMTMAGIAAKSEGDTRYGLKLLSGDARSMPMSPNDRDYMLERLQRVSFEIDKDDWVGAQDELQNLRWRYGRF